jgi:hypothetical protein
MELVQDKTRLSIPLLWFPQASEGEECSNAMGINKYDPHKALSNYACARQITTFENKTNSCLEFTTSASSPRSKALLFLDTHNLCSRSDHPSNVPPILLFFQRWSVYPLPNQVLCPRTMRVIMYIEPVYITSVSLLDVEEIK